MQIMQTMYGCKLVWTIFACKMKPQILPCLQRFGSKGSNFSVFYAVLNVVYIPQITVPTHEWYTMSRHNLSHVWYLSFNIYSGISLKKKQLKS